MRPADSWGPFTPGLDAGERLARLRVLRTLVALYAGPAGHEAAQALQAAESDPAASPRALLAFDALPTRCRRGALATYARVHAPHRESR